MNDTPGYFADWFPTLCEAAGLEKPAGLDGDSLWPVLLGRAAPKERKPMVWVFPEYAGQVAVRSGNFKAVRQNHAPRSPGAWGPASTWPRCAPRPTRWWPCASGSTR